MIFWTILISIPVLNLAWWAWADWRLRRSGFATKWRWTLAAFVLIHLAGYAWVIVSRRAGLRLETPQLIIATTYIWSMIILPLATFAAATLLVLGGVNGVWKWFKRPASPATPVQGEAVEPTGLSRRQVIAAMAVGAPVAVHGAALGRGLTQLGAFRVRTIETSIAGLPESLDGVTIAHVTDSHVGRFTRGAVLDRIAAKVNELDPDFVAFTGDLIDYSMDDLPEAIGFLRKMRPRHGLVVCEGNHDLFEGVEAFRSGVRGAGITLLTGESATYEVRGREVQFLGLQWPGGLTSKKMQRLTSQVRDGATPIVLAHHPHAFEQAAEAGIPLTLAGHTHGGQLMLTQELGAGPAIFRYWSGLYRAGNASVVVSNGVGNWFPLRVNAPAEIVRIVLRRAEA